MDPSSICLSHVDIHSTYGAYLLGVIASASLFGVICIQMFTFFSTYYARREPLMKWTISFLWLLESAHLAYSIHTVYYYLVTNYSNPLALLQLIWAPVVNIGIMSMVICIVHVSYARRIYILSEGKNKLIPISIVTSAALNLGLSWVSVAKLLLHDGGPGKIDGLPLNLLKASLAVVAVLDIVVTVTETSILIRLRPTRPVVSTEMLLNKLIRYAISTGALTVAFALSVLLLIVFDSKNLIYLAVAEVSFNVYTISLLSVLNSRKRLGQSLHSAPPSGSLPHQSASAGSLRSPPPTGIPLVPMNTRTRSLSFSAV